MEQKEFIVKPTYQNPQTREKFTYGLMSIREANRFAAMVTLSGFEFISSGFCAVVPNISAQKAVRIFGDNYEGNSILKGSKETRKMDEKQVFNPKGVRRRTRNEYIRARKIEAEWQTDFTEFIATYNNNLLSAGFATKWKSRGPASYFINRVVADPVRRQIGNLVLNGDRDAADTYISQFDGVLKQVAKAADKGKYHTISHKYPAMTAGTYVHLLVSNKEITVPFTTDQATTLTAIIDAINAVNYNGSLIVEASQVDVDGNAAVEVKSKHLDRNVEVRVAVSTDATIEWKSVHGELNGGVVNVKETQGQNYEKPYQLPYLDWTQFIGSGFDSAVTMANIKDRLPNIREVVDWVMYLILALSEKQRKLRGTNQTLITYFSDEMMTLMQLAFWLMTQQTNGAVEQPNLSIFRNFRTHPDLHGSTFFSTYANNIFIGTDLMSDISMVDINYDWREQTIDMRLAAAMGVKVLEPGHFVSNAPAFADKFGDMDTYADQFSDVMKIDQELLNQANWTSIAQQNGWTPPEA